MINQATITEGEFTEATAGERLDSALARVLADLSRERIKALIRDGQVMIDGTVARRASTPVSPGQRYALALPPPRPLAVEAEDLPLDVVFEDEHLIVIDKPAGLVVHPAAGHHGGTLVNALLHHCAGQLSGIGGVERPGIVHRIDKDTSGLLVVAKSDQAHQGLAEQFAAHTIDRRYAALVHGHPKPAEGRVEGNIGRSASDRKKMAIVSGDRGKHAVTHYRVEERLNQSALIECRLETGRTHQVRVHMASLGHPLLGDPVYSRSDRGLKTMLKTLDFRRQALHARTLGFIHPVTEAKCDFSSPIPDDMMELLRALRV